MVAVSDLSWVKKNIGPGGTSPSAASHCQFLRVVQSRAATTVGTAAARSGVAGAALTESAPLRVD